MIKRIGPGNKKLIFHGVGSMIGRPMIQYSSSWYVRLDDAHNSPSVSQKQRSKFIPQAIRTDGEEEKVYLQLLFATVASLVLVVFVVVLIFSCWWIKNQKLDADPDNTETSEFSAALMQAADVFIIQRSDCSVRKQRELQKPDHFNDRPKKNPEKPLKADSSNNHTGPDGSKDPELIELLPSSVVCEDKDVNKQPTAQIYISPTTAYATISLASTTDMFVPSPSIVYSGAHAHLPQYVFAGGVTSQPSVTYGQSASAAGSAVLNAPVLISASAAGLVQQDTSTPAAGSSVAYVKLAPSIGLANAVSQLTPFGSTTKTDQPSTTLSSDRSRSRGSNSLQNRTLPVRRHVAKEFLDESMVATMTRSRGRAIQQSLVQPSIVDLTTPSLSGANAGDQMASNATIFSLQSPVVLIRNEHGMSGISGENTTGLLTAAPVVSDSSGTMLGLSAVDNDLFAVNSGANALPLYMSREPRVGLMEIFAQNPVSSESILLPPHSSEQQSHIQQQQRAQLDDLHNQQQGSDETSGILSDSEGSTNLTAGDFVFSKSMLASSPSVGASAQLVARNVPALLPLSILTGASRPSGTTYVSTDLIAEMASCPQHSYLFRQSQTQDTIEENGTGGESESDTVGTTRAKDSTLIARHLASSTASGLEASKSPSSLSVRNHQPSAVGSSNPGSSASSIQTVIAADEFALGSGTGVPDVPGLFSEKSAPSQKTTGRATPLSSRIGPNPPKRGVSLTGGGEKAAPSADNIVLATDDSNQNTVEDKSTVNQSTTPHHRTEVKAATLGRTPSGDTPKVDMSPGSSATLPTSTTNPRSALKSADRSGPKVSKHLRFTTLTVICLMLLVAMVLGSPDQSTSMFLEQISTGFVDRPLSHSWNVIRAFPTADQTELLSNQTTVTGVDSNSPTVIVTVWLPKDMIPKMDSNLPRSSNSATTGARKSPSRARRAPQSIQLWLNSSSLSEVRVLPPLERSSVDIYDVVNAHQILGTRICRQRYACEHSCDPGARHDCICQRGYRPAGPADRARLAAQGKRLESVTFENAHGRICLDVDECARPELRQECARLGGVCTNRPGDYACLCAAGKPCLPCSRACPTGMFEARACGPRSDRVCQEKSVMESGLSSGKRVRPFATYHSVFLGYFYGSQINCSMIDACRPLCISEEFEFAPCKASSNRICKLQFLFDFVMHALEIVDKSLIPELVVPYKKNIWFENLQQVRDALVSLTPDDVAHLPPNKSVVLDRSSGYQVRLDFDSLNLVPVLGPVDHASGNDNSLFLAAANVLDRAATEPDSYRWSSATGQYQTMHAFTLKANNTLSKLCPYPVPPLYRLGLRAHRNVTTATVPDTSLPGHRPVLAGCRTYRRHGYFPPIDVITQDASKMSDSHRSPFYLHDRAATSVTESETGAPVIACLEPSRLPAIFGSHWNIELASHRAVYYEEKQLCGQLKLDCQHCLAACAEELKSSSLTCKPTSSPADNGRSPRLEICFDCCARDNCSDVCDKYPAHRCHMQLCNYGLRLDFPLTPEWPKQGEFLCHVQPALSRPIYRLHWSLVYRGRPLTPDRFPAALMLSNADTNSDQWNAADTQTAPELWNFDRTGQVSQIYRGLLNVQYSSGLDHLPDMIGGTDTMQSAYFWSKQTIPLVSGSATNAAFDPLASAASAASTGAMYANAVRSSPSSELTSIQVWPSQPLGVSTAAWARLSGAPCAAADPLLEKLNIYTPALPPYIAMGESKLTLSLPRSASLLGAVFNPASVERGQYLRASLALAWLTDSQTADYASDLEDRQPEPTILKAGKVNEFEGPQRFWVIDLTGQVDQFPGLFRLRVFLDNDGLDSKDNGFDEDRVRGEPLVSGSYNGGQYYSQSSDADATVEVEEEGGGDPLEPNGGDADEQPYNEPLLDYDIGVFEERKFQLRILIPGPDREPDYEKAFRLVILDAKNRLSIRVKRAVQPPDEMAMRQSYERPPEDDTRPALIDLLPSLAARHQAYSRRGELPPAERTEDPNSHQQTDQSQLSKLTSFGPPPSLVFSVLIVLGFLLLLLFCGLVLRPDPTLSWVKWGRDGNVHSNVEGDRVALVTNPSRRSYNTQSSRWCRVVMLVGYLCFKSAYTFGVTLTALVILIRYMTSEPTSRLANLPEWTGAMDQAGHFMDSSLTRQKLLQDAMDVHLQAELLRQQGEVRRMREICDRGVEQMFDQMETRLSSVSALSASRRSRILLSQAVAELARAAATASMLQLAEGLMTFNRTSEWAIHRLRSDLLETERALADSDWLTGARIIYAEVVRLRELIPDPTDPTRSFLTWAKLIMGRDSSANDLVPFNDSLQLASPSLLPLLEPTQFRVPTPNVRTGSDRTQNGGVESDEPEYGPKYVPFVPTPPVDMEGAKSFWITNVVSPGEISGEMERSPQDDGVAKSLSRSKNLPLSTSTTGSPSTAGRLFANLQVGWVHVLGAALLLDALWLIHRVLHTVDTAERLLYGDVLFIDLTEEGLRRRLFQKSRWRMGLKHALETAMQPGAMRKLCASVLALLVVTQAAAHIDRLLSQDTLDYIGYYDSLVLPVHLHARLVNVHVSRSAQRLNQYELAGLESEVSRRLREAQFLLHEWTGWLHDVEQEQCRLLLAYKAAAQDVRTRMAAKINRNPSFSKLHLPIHVIHSQSEIGLKNNATHWFGLRAEAMNSERSQSTTEAVVPRHCRMTQSEKDLELSEARHLDIPHCPLKAIVPRLFKDYNVSDYFDEVVEHSEAWLSAARDCLSQALYCLFVYVSAIILWNALGSVLWFYLDRFNILPKKIMFESDLSSWQPL
ncbi:unnamed protein product [Calicophoron daubneyi]|uniref:TNFR-Cys domain-containing protein n=1 Tax=Calicophoron daubneyi TaxID=300641 RepID=A0AAV2TYM9_CALDB